MKIGAIIQARISSSRLPGKVLKELPYGSGITALQQIMRRLKKSNRLDDIILATSTQEEDTVIVKESDKENIKSFRGSLNNVQERYYLAAQDNHLDVVVRITADCPCVDAHIVDLIIERHIQKKADFTSNVIKRTFADGFDVEVFNFNVLRKINSVSQDKAEQEHVTLHIYRNPEKFKIANVEANKRLYGPDKRVTLDTPRDYALLCAIYDALYPKNKYFDAGMIMDFFREKPWMVLINAK